MLLNIISDVMKAVYIKSLYKDLGIVKIIEDESSQIIKLNIIPHQGLHKNKIYTITCKFKSENNWPLVLIDSEIYDKFKTYQYLKNSGYMSSEHKGICIKNLSYGYDFSRNFQKYCGNKWENYIYNLIIFFNNPQDIQKASGFKSKLMEKITTDFSN